MVAYGGTELANSFQTVRNNTIQIAEDIPEAQYGFEAAAGVRSVGDILKHIAVSPMLYEDMHRVRRVTTLQGYDFPAMIGQLTAEAEKPRTKAELVAWLRSEGDRLAAWLRSLSMDFLGETFADHTGAHSRTRLESLLSIKEHEMHHRGQLMLTERLLGIVPHLTRARQQMQQQRPAS